MNVQLAKGASWSKRSAQIHDFGHFSAEPHFKTAFATMTMNCPFSIGRIVRPRQAPFVQPEPNVAIDALLASRISVQAVGLYLAQAFRANALIRSDIETVYRPGLLRCFGRRRSSKRSSLSDDR